MRNNNAKRCICLVIMFVQRAYSQILFHFIPLKQFHSLLLIRSNEQKIVHFHRVSAYTHLFRRILHKPLDKNGVSWCILVYQLHVFIERDIISIDCHFNFNNSIITDPQSNALIFMILSWFHQPLYASITHPNCLLPLYQTILFVRKISLSTSSFPLLVSPTSVLLCSIPSTILKSNIS